MLEFKITQELKPNPKLLELIKDFTYKTKKGKVKVLLNTNSNPMILPDFV